MSFYFLGCLCFVLTGAVSLHARADDPAASSSANYDKQNAQDDSELDQELNQDDSMIPNMPKNAPSAPDASSSSTAAPAPEPVTTAAPDASEPPPPSTTAPAPSTPAPTPAAPNPTAETQAPPSAPAAEPAAPDAEAQPPKSEPLEPAPSTQPTQLEPTSEPPPEQSTESPEPPDTEPPPENSSAPQAAPEMTTQQEQPPGEGDDEPNLQYEAKLHDIYLHYYSQRTPDDKWKNIAGKESAEQYQIRRGDNLWNISKTFFGDGNYWPKVWSLNGAITNPHEINPKDSIKFVEGDEENPPDISISDNGSSNEDQSGQSSENSEQPELPPPSVISRPVVKHLPPSLPEWQDLTQLGHYDELGMEFVKRKILEIKDQIPLVSYVAETRLDSHGRIAEVETGNRIASSYQYVYVRMKPGEGQVGETLLAVANRGRVQSVDPAIKGFLGYAVDILGEVQLIEQVRSKNEQKLGPMFRALVLRIVNPVTVGADLVQGHIENVLMTETGPRSSVVAQIVGGSFFNKRQVYGNESVAYLNRGENDGLKVGDILPIRANRSVRNSNTQVLEDVRPIGWLRVVKTTPHFATALVVRAWSDVLTGDLTGYGPLVSKDISENATAGATGANQTSKQDADSSDLNPDDLQ